MTVLLLKQVHQTLEGTENAESRRPESQSKLSDRQGENKLGGKQKRCP